MEPSAQTESACCTDASDQPAGCYAGWPLRYQRSLMCNISVIGAHFGFQDRRAWYELLQICLATWLVRRCLQNSCSRWPCSPTVPNPNYRLARFISLSYSASWVLLPVQIFMLVRIMLLNAGIAWPDGSHCSPFQHRHQEPRQSRAISLALSWASALANLILPRNPMSQIAL